MSTPITTCLIGRATIDEAAYAELLGRLRYIKRHGAMSVWPCHCEPPCATPSDEQLDALWERLEIDLANRG